MTNEWGDIETVDHWAAAEELILWIIVVVGGIVLLPLIILAWYERWQYRRNEVTE